MRLSERGGAPALSNAPIPRIRSMKKLRLDIDQIEVSGFDSMPAEADTQGTVNGAELISRFTYCFQETCPYSCEDTCV